MSESKFVICPKCGSVTPKTDSFCSYCGADIKGNTIPTKDTTQTQTFSQPLPQAQTQRRTTTQLSQSDYAALQDLGGEALENTAEVESLIRYAYIFIIIGFCSSIVIFPLIALILILLARRKGASPQRIQTILYLALFGVVVDTVSMVIFILRFLGVIQF